MTTRNLRPYVPIARRDLAGNDRGRPRSGLELVTELIAPLTLVIQGFVVPLQDILGLESIVSSFPWRAVYLAAACFTLIAGFQTVHRTSLRLRERQALERWARSYICRRTTERAHAAR